MKHPRYHLYRRIALLLACFSALAFANNFNNDHLAQALGSLRTSLIDLSEALHQKPACPRWQLEWQKTLGHIERNQELGTDKKTFDIAIIVKAGAHYRTLNALKEIVKNTSNNKQCIKFKPTEHWHVTLAYIKIPISGPEAYQGREEQLKQDLANKIAQELKGFKSALHTLTFSYATTDFLGKNNEFLVSRFTSNQGTDLIKETFLLPLAQKILQTYSDAWLDYIKEITFHITLGKIKETCTFNDIQIPSQLPKVADYALSKGQLEVSVQGPKLKKPLHVTVATFSNPA